MNKSKSYTISQLSSIINSNHSNATNIALKGMNTLLNEATRLINREDAFKQGNFFEIIESTKFNIDAAIKKSSLNSIRTEDIGFPHHPVDILIIDGRKIVGKVQAKSGSSPTTLAFSLRDKKYQGMQKLVNVEKADRVVELSEKRAVPGSINENGYLDNVENVSGKLNYGSVSSEGTTFNEAIQSAKDTEQYVDDFMSKEFQREISTSIRNTAITYGAVSGASSMLKNSILLMRNETCLKEATIDVGSNTLKGTIKGGTSGGLSALYRTKALKSGNGVLSNSSVSTSLAVATIDVGISVYRFAKREIDLGELMLEIGETGFRSVSGIYSGLLFGVAFGPIGYLVGSVGGYVLSSNVYHSSIEILKSSSLSIEEANVVKELLEEARLQMEHERLAFEQILNDRVHEKDQLISTFLERLKREQFLVDTTDYSSLLNELSFLLNKKVPILSFTEFDELMRKQEKLII